MGQPIAVFYSGKINHGDMMFKKIDVKEKAQTFEKRVNKFWEKNNIPKKSETLRENAPNYVFYEGPPTANGMPGIHHAMSRTLKDTVCRYKTMKGFQVKEKQAGILTVYLWKLKYKNNSVSQIKKRLKLTELLNLIKNAGNLSLNMKKSGAK